MIKDSLPHPTAILLDWDGTIKDSMQQVHDVLQGINIDLGLPPLTMAQVHETTIHGPRAGTMVLGMNAEENDHHFRLFSERFFVFNGSVSLLDGAKEFFMAIPDDVPVGIVSNCQGKLLRQEIEHLGWDWRIGAIVGVNEAPKNKPAPDAALFALELLGVQPSKSVWFVGDTRGDIECAQAAGLTSILLAPSEPKDCAPHHRFADFIPLRKHFTL